MKRKLFLSLLLIVFLVTLSGCTFKRNDSNNQVINNDNKDTSIVGRWDAYSAVNTKTGKETKNFREVFGSSYAKYGSYLEIHEDGTFLDAIEPITNGSKAATGKYEILKDYNQVGDFYVVLKHYDEYETKLRKVKIDDSDREFLVLENSIGDYQITLVHSKEE